MTDATRQALTAFLTAYGSHDSHTKSLDDAAELARAALQQPEAGETDKPFGYHFWKDNGDGTESPDFCQGEIPSWKRVVRNVTPLFTAPPASADLREALFNLVEAIKSTFDCEALSMAFRRRLQDADKALANARGTTSEGGECACGKFDDGKSCPDANGRPLCVHPNAPDPTPPDPVQGAEPSASKATATAASVEAGRTGGANPPTGATPPDREDGPPAGKIDWVDCPICGEPDMRKRTTPGGLSLIDCVNHACPSNGGVSTPPDREAVALEIWHRFAENSTIEWADETHKSEYLMCADAILALTSGRR